MRDLTTKGCKETQLTEDCDRSPARILPSDPSVDDDILKSEIQKYLAMKSARATKDVRAWSAQNTARISFDTMGFDDFEVNDLQFSSDKLPEVLTKDMNFSIIENKDLAERLLQLENSIEGVSRALLLDLESRDDLRIQNEQLRKQIKRMHDQVEAHKKRVSSKASKNETCIIY
mmetsp:Transcript_11440/g.22436  ORF Transcript_11440/g.22436 Transcript_11440/m.22436 type:complete len:174 (-) Transcript_11440:22-543(-)